MQGVLYCPRSFLSFHFCLPSFLHLVSTNDSYRFISKLMDVYLIAGVHQQPDQSNCLAEGQT